MRRLDMSDRTAGDSFISWLGALHTGSFGGLLVKLLWAVVGLALPLLVVTGATVWWGRVGKRLNGLSSPW